MVQKPQDEDLSQAFANLINSPALNALYESTIDATFKAFARNVTFYLEPGRSLPSQNAPTFNSFQGVGGQDPRLDTSNKATGNKGVEITTISVIYKAHIKHAPAYLEDKLPFALNLNEVALTTVYESLVDIRRTVEADIDGSRYVIQKGARPIGFADKKYVISVWERKIAPGLA